MDCFNFSNLAFREMRVLFWYCDQFNWTPAKKTLEDAPEAEPAENEKSVVVFIQVEPPDIEKGNAAETKLVKKAIWLARKWEMGSPIKRPCQ